MCTLSTIRETFLAAYPTLHEIEHGIYSQNEDLYHSLRLDFSIWAFFFLKKNLIYSLKIIVFFAGLNIFPCLSVYFIAIKSFFLSLLII